MSSEQLSDFEPKGATCAALGVLHAGGFPERALVIFDPDGVVRWSYQADSPGELPALKLLREGLDRASAATPPSERTGRSDPSAGDRSSRAAAPHGGPPPSARSTPAVR